MFYMETPADSPEAQCSYADPLSFIGSSKSFVSAPNITFYFNMLIPAPAYLGKQLFELEPSLIHFQKNIKPFAFGSI